MDGFTAVIFDMDGVLVDSEPLFLKAINKLLTALGVSPVTDYENESILIGTTVDETWNLLIKMRSLPGTIHTYLDNYDTHVKEVLKSDLVPRPGVKTLIDECSKRGIPKAVASSSLREWVHLKLDTINLQDRFDVVLGGDDVQKGKPEPDIYLMAAEKLQKNPSQCIAIEDSPVGISAAVDAGIYTIAVLTESTKNLDLSKANEIIETLEYFNYSILRA